MKCENCGKRINRFGNNWAGTTSAQWHLVCPKQQAKRSPARVSLRRRVGRSASGGQPGAVARIVGRKGAQPAEYVFEVGVVNIMTHRTEWREIARYVDESIAQFVWLANKKCVCRYREIEQPAAVSRRPQRAIPANDKLSHRRAETHE